MNKRRKILAAMLAAFMLLVPMVSTAQIDIKGDGGETSNLSGTWGTMRITDNETEDYVPLGEGLWLLAGAAGLYLLVKSRKTRKATAVAAAALALTLGTTQCKKTEESVIPAGETISISFMAGNGAKADIDVYTGRITWEKDDEVYVVYDGKLLSESPLLATPVDQNSVNATISGTITTTVTIVGDNPSFTFYYVGSGVDFTPTEASTNLTFDISSQNGIDAGHYMVGRTGAVEMQKDGSKYVPREDGAKHFDPLTSVLRLDTKAFGACQMTMSGGNSQMKIDLANPGAPIYNPGSSIMFSGDADARISVVPTTAPDENENVTLSFSGNGKDGSITVKNGIKEGRIYSKVINNAGYPIPVEANAPGVLSGKFTINENGDQVYFSQGNLQYLAQGGSGGSASAEAVSGASVGGTWRFAEHQYDIKGSDNNKISQTNTDWIDLFGWGTSGYNHNGKCYMPWSTNKDYQNYYAYTDPDKDLNVSPFYADWGYNRISNGGNIENSGWRTLTISEWDYLLQKRSGEKASEIGDKTDCRCAMVKVNGTNGLLIFPDEFTWPQDVEFKLTTFNGSSSSWNNVDYTESDFSKLQSAGAVFLPAGCTRDGSSFSSGHFCSYWSSTKRADDSKAAHIHFNDGAFDTDRSDNTYAGQSVRLVMDVPNASNGGSANDFGSGTWVE